MVSNTRRSWGTSASYTDSETHSEGSAKHSRNEKLNPHEHAIETTALHWFWLAEINATATWKRSHGRPLSWNSQCICTTSIWHAQKAGTQSQIGAKRQFHGLQSMSTGAIQSKNGYNCGSGASKSTWDNNDTPIFQKCPVFAQKKRKGNLRLLVDLRKINNLI